MWLVIIIKKRKWRTLCQKNFLKYIFLGILSTLTVTNSPANQMEVNQVLDNALATIMHTTQCAVNLTFTKSLGAIVYNWDMLVDVPLITDLIVIRDQRQALADKNLQRQNAKQWKHVYTVK